MVTRIKAPIVVKGEENKEKLGMVHIITGDGKGKTTSAIGLGMRAIGNNLSVYVIQFLKSGFTGELATCKRLGITIEQFGMDALKEKQKHLAEFSDDKTGKFTFQPDELEREAAIQGFTHAKDIVKSGKYDVVIMDEINCVLDKGLIPMDQVIDMIKNHGKVELLLTGRDAPAELFEYADYVNVISGQKHPWQKGIVARKGIEY